MKILNYYVLIFVTSLLLLNFPTQLYGRDEVITESHTIQVGQYVDISLAHDYWMYSVTDASVIEKVKDVKDAPSRWIGKKAGQSTIVYYGVSWSGNYTVWYGDKIDQFYCEKIVTINVVDVKTISIPTNIGLSIGDTFKYTPIITDKDAQTTYTWQSSDPSVATVDANGLLEAKGKGWSCITCTASNGVFAQSFVTVSPVLAKNVTLDKSNFEISVGEQEHISFDIIPENVTSKNVKWLSSNENIAQVDAFGNVHAINPGYCSIFAKADDGSGKYEKCVVHVVGTIERGDVNGDGSVSVTDVVTLIDILLNDK